MRKPLTLIIVAPVIAVMAACGTSTAATSAPSTTITVTPDPDSSTDTAAPAAQPVPATATTPVTPSVNVADAAYLLTLDRLGVRYSTGAAAINVGHLVCSAIDEGHTAMDVGFTIVASGNYDTSDAGHIVGAAVSAYCPQYNSELQQQH